MNKFMSIGLAAVFAAGFVSAENGVVMVDQSSFGSEVEATAEIALVSAQVWRGQVQNEDFVIQPQFTISSKGVSFNVWGNYNFSQNYAGVDNAMNEFDFSLAYTLPLDLNDISFDLGVINYQFPANGDEQGKATTELFVAAHILTFRDYVIPSVTFYGDIKEVDGTYIQFDVVAPYRVSEYLYLEAGISTGWGSGSYNKAYWGIDGGHKGFNDYNFFGTASYEVSDQFSVSVNMTYTGVYGGVIKDGAKATYDAGEKMWGGVNFAYDF
ncbi:MAG: TorF family putative porin [Pontiella sp.]